MIPIFLIAFIKTVLILTGASAALVFAAHLITPAVTKLFDKGAKD